MERSFFLFALHAAIEEFAAEIIALCWFRHQQVGDLREKQRATHGLFIKERKAFVTKRVAQHSVLELSVALLVACLTKTKRLARLLSFVVVTIVVFQLA